MRLIRNRASNWLRRELLRGINDYLDETLDAGDGPERLTVCGSGGCRVRCEPSAMRQDLPAAAAAGQPTLLSYGC